MVENLSSEFLILRNRRRIPERFHSGPAISGISLAPFPGTLTARRARVNGLFEFTDSCLLLFLPTSFRSDPQFRSLFLTTRNLSIEIRPSCYCTSFVSSIILFLLLFAFFAFIARSFFYYLTSWEGRKSVTC